MAITTVRRPKLSRPRQAAAVVESAALVSAAVLLVWLALWLSQQRAQGLVIHSRHLRNPELSAADAPFLAADARAIRGAEAVEASPSGFIKGVEALVSAPGGPILVYLAAPLLGVGPEQPIGDASLIDLIENVVASARRDVVLAVDLAQVDSDRDLGVYAASPYQGLADAVARLKPGSHPVYVLTSAAAAQKSWASDALGGSVFAHFLRAGLATHGGAERWSKAGSPGRVDVEGLHRFVRDHVALWAEKYRHAVQTPMLVRIGDEPRRPVLLALSDPVAIAAPASVPAPAPATEPKAEPKGSAPEIKTVEPRVALLNDVVEEWKKHDELVVATPWRSAPARFRGYQASLLLAERRLRSAWNEPSALAEARAELNAAISHRDHVRAAIQKAEADAAEFPFRAVRRDEAGRRDLTAALVHLTRSGPEPDLYLAPTPVAQPSGGEKPAEPAAKAPSPATPPAALTEALAAGYPEHHLELQLPAWALRYVEAYRVPEYFWEGRGGLLRGLVGARSRAEDALAVDPRGLDWGRALVAKGDEERRRLQDRLFAPAETEGEAGKALADQVAALSRQHYDPARSRVNAFHEGRAVWERCAARLADLAEWAVRARPPASRDDPLPPNAVAALEDAEGLVRSLERDPTDESAEEVGRRSEAIVEATRKAGASLDALERAMLASVRSGAWKARDAALRTPWIPWESRKALLEAVTRAPEAMEPFGPSSSSPAEAGDPGFWTLAAGLAALDERLRRFAHPSGPAGGDDGAHVREAWEAIRSGEGPGADRAFAAFGAYAKASRERRAQERDGRASRLSGEPRKPEALHAILREQDRAVRLLGRHEALADPAADGRVAEWDALGRFRALDFQLSRLREDDVPAAPPLVARKAAAARLLNLVPGADPFAGWVPLAVQVDPPGVASVQIGEEDGRADIRIGLKRNEEGQVRIPHGHAFVGLTSAPAALEIRGGKSGAAPPAGTLKEVGAGIDSTLDAYTIRQVDATTVADPYPLAAVAFYRGRVDPRGIIPLEVIPRSFPRLVQVRMTYDPDDVRRRFGSLADGIEDQFALHPGFGYMHRGKAASYRLVFENLTFQPLKVSCRRMLMAGPDKPGSPIDAQDVVLDLPPRQAAHVSGVVTSAQVPFEEVRTLRVEYKVVGRTDPAATYDVQFAQVGLKDYMEATPLIRVVKDYGDGVARDSYVVDFRRRADDKVREPILSDEIVVTVNGEEQPGLTIWPGRPGFHAYSARTTNARKFTWSARFGKDSFEPREAAP